MTNDWQDGPVPTAGWYELENVGIVHLRPVVWSSDGGGTPGFACDEPKAIKGSVPLQEMSAAIRWRPCTPARFDRRVRPIAARAMLAGAAVGTMLALLPLPIAALAWLAFILGFVAESRGNAR